MKLAGKSVMFRLSPEGRQALKGLVPESGAFETRVEDEDARGLWIRLPEQPTVRAGQPIPVMLLKWHHFSTATVIFEPAPSASGGSGSRQPR